MNKITIAAAAFDRGFGVAVVCSGFLEGARDPCESSATAAVRRRLRVSAVDDRDRVDLDEVLGPGQCLYPHNRVGWLVIAEQRRPGLFDH
jgi:hypothetical protein